MNRAGMDAHDVLITGVMPGNRVNPLPTTTRTVPWKDTVWKKFM